MFILYITLNWKLYFKVSHNLSLFDFLEDKIRNKYYLPHVSPPEFEMVVIVLSLFFPPPDSSSYYSSRQLRRMVKSIFKNIGCEQLVKAEMSSDGSGDDFSYLTDTALNSIELHIIIVRKLLLFEFFSSFQVRVLNGLVTMLISLSNKEKGDLRVRTFCRQQYLASIQHPFVYNILMFMVSSCL